MFTDIVGYSKLSQKDEALALELLDRHCRMMRPLFPKHGGKEIKTIGDAFLVEFESAVEAVKCAVEIQGSLNRLNNSIPEREKIQIRIGIHVGDIIQREGDILGDGVNITSRIEPLAEPGGICLTDNSLTVIVDLVRAIALSGKTEKAGKLFNDLLLPSEQKYVSPYNKALIYCALGKTDRALEHLEEAYEKHSNNLVLLKIDPRFDNMRSRPRFKSLMRKLRLQ